MQQKLSHYPFPPRLTTPLAITHATVIPMDTEHVLFDHTILIEDGCITALAPSSTFPIEPGYRLADATGKYVIPGLADMHVHFSAPGDAAMFLAHGVTTVRNMSGAPMHLAFQQQVQQKTFPGPYLMTTGPICEGAAPIPPSWYLVKGASEAEEVVRQCLQRGYQQIKVYNQLTPQTLRALGDVARATGLKLSGHCPNLVTFEEAMDAGMICFEHLTGIWRGHLNPGYAQRAEQPNLDMDVLHMTVEQMDFEAIRRLAQQMARNQVWNCPTLVALQYMHEPQTSCLADPTFQPLLKYIPHAALHLWEQLDPSRFRGASYEAWHEMLHARNHLFSRIVSVLHEEGAPLLIGTDTAVRFVLQGFSVHQELANFVAAGLQPFEALRCATSEAARFVQQEALWGTVAVGKQASLLLLKANPLEQIAAVKELDAVCVNGFYLDRTNLDEILTQQETVAATRPPSALSLTSFPYSADEGTITRRERWLEQTAGIETGEIVYQHRQLSTGDWLIEERYTFERGDLFSIGGVQWRTTSLRLAPDLTLRYARIISESFLGTEQQEIRWQETGRYVLQRHDLDGAEREEILETHPLLPSETLSATTLILFLCQTTPVSAEQTILSVDPHEMRVLPMTMMVEMIPKQTGGEDKGRVWQIQVKRPEQTTSQRYCLTAEGHLLQIKEGERSLTPGGDW